MSTRESGSPRLGDLIGWRSNGAEGIVLADESGKRPIWISIAHDGEMRFQSFVGEPNDHGAIVIYDGVQTGNVGNALAVEGALLSTAGFVGAVDVGVAVTGLLGSVAFTLHRGVSALARPDEGYPHGRYTATAQVQTWELVEQPHAVADQVLRRLIDALLSYGYEPYVGTSVADS